MWFNNIAKGLQEQVEKAGQDLGLKETLVRSISSQTTEQLSNRITNVLVNYPEDTAPVQNYLIHQNLSAHRGHDPHRAHPILA